MGKVAGWCARYVGVAALAAGLGCGNAETQRRALETIEIYSYSTAGPTSECLAAMLGLFAPSHPDTRIVDRAREVSAGSASRLDLWVSQGNPPDLFEIGAGRDLVRWVTLGTASDGASLLEPLDSLEADEGYRSEFPDAVLQQTSFGGHLYAVPVDVERINLLYYNKKILDAFGLSPPTTLDDFFVVGEALKAKGIVPLAVGSAESWLLGMIAWQWLLLEEASADYYVEFFKGNRNPDDRQIGSTLAKLSRVLDQTNYKVKSSDVAALLAQSPSAPDPENPRGLGAIQAAELVFEGRAAMTMQWDWAKAYLQAKGWQPDEDFGELPAPGTKGTYLFFSDAFGLPVGARNRGGAFELLKTFGSAEAQVACAARAGRIPARIDADKTQFDEMTQRRMTDLASAKVVVPIVEMILPADVVTVVNDSLLRFAEDRDVDGEIRRLRDIYGRFARP